MDHRTDGIPNDGFSVLVLRPCFYNNNEFITSEINQTLRTGITLHEFARPARSSKDTEA